MSVGVPICSTLPEVHHSNAVAHGERFLLVVRHVDERDADLPLDPLELELHGVAQLEIECAERLVEQQCAWVVDQCAGQRDALLLATGQLGRLALGEVGEPDDLEDLVDAAVLHLPALSFFMLRGP